MPIMNRGETICQEETEPGRWVREQVQEEEWADASAHQSMANTLCLESGASFALVAEECKAGAWDAVLRESILRLRKKTRWNSSVRC